MKRKLTINEELNRMKGLMVYQNGEYKNPILKEQNDIPPSVNKSVEFGPGFYRVKGNYTGKSGTKWSWDVEETLNTELQKIKNFLTKNPSGYIVNVNLSAGESKIPNVDREQNGKKVNPGHLSKNRMETIKNYVQKVFDSWLKEGIIKDKINFSVKNPKIGSTDWVGQPFCPKEKRGDDPQGYKCGKDYRNSPNYKTLKDTYTKEQFVNVSISVDKFEEEGGGGGIPITENCAVGLEIIVQTPKHNCNNAEFFIFANKTLIKNVDGGDTHNGSNSDKEVRINKFNLDSKVLNPAYGKLGTLKYGTTGDNGGARYDKFIITPEQSKKITSQSNDGTMKIWAVCAKSTCHSDLVSITIKHPSKKENVFGPQKVKSNNSILTILSPCGDVSLSDISMGGLEKDAPDVQNFRNKWFKERKELTLKLNNGVEPDGELDFKSTLLHRTSKITDIVDDYVRDIQILFEESQKRKLPENVKRDWFIENFDELSDGDISDYYTELLTGNDEKQPTFAMKKGNQTSIGNGTYSFSHKWVRKDELSGDIRDQMSKVFNVLNQIFQTEGLVIGDLKLRTDIGEKIYKQLKSGKKLKKVKDIQIAVGVDGNSTQLK